MPVVGMNYDTRLVKETTVQGTFGSVDGLTASLGALHFGPGKSFLQLHEHPALVLVLGESSLEGMDPTLMLRVDCFGFSDAGQETIRALKVKDSTWKFELVIVVVLHPELINYRRGDILSDYFEINIISITL